MGFYQRLVRSFAKRGEDAADAHCLVAGYTRLCSCCIDPTLSPLLRSSLPARNWAFQSQGFRRPSILCCASWRERRGRSRRSRCTGWSCSTWRQRRFKVFPRNGALVRPVRLTRRAADAVERMVKGYERAQNNYVRREAERVSRILQPVTGIRLTPLLDGPRCHRSGPPPRARSRSRSSTPFRCRPSPPLQCTCRANPSDGLLLDYSTLQHSHTSLPACPSSSRRSCRCRRPSRRADSSTSPLRPASPSHHFLPSPSPTYENGHRPSRNASALSSRSSVTRSHEGDRHGRRRDH